MTKTVSYWTRSATLLLLAFVGLTASPAAAPQRGVLSEGCYRSVRLAAVSLLFTHPLALFSR
jgi:hypothetical protein